MNNNGIFVTGVTVLVNFLISGMLAYVIGSFSSSIMLSYWLHTPDIRTLGSGNAGATNVYRNHGMSAGIIALLSDCFKTLLALFIAQMLGIKGALLALIGLIIILGHCYPIFHHFKGGKGVAVASVCLCMVHLPTALVTISLFSYLFWRTKTVSIATLGSAAITPLVGLILAPFKIGLVMLSYTIVIFWQHRDNIKRLATGQEKKLTINPNQ
jgi:acyl phosphate:glycerol-3-phosphate acyltransferase